MITVLKNEFYKLFRGKKLYVSILIITLIYIAAFMAIKAAPNTEEFFELKTGTISNLGSFMLVMFNQTLIPVLGIVLITDIFTEDYKQGTLKYTVMQPISRSEVMVGKISAIFVYVEMLFLFIFVMHILCSVLILNKPINGAEIATTLYSFTMSSIPLMGFFSICIFVSLIVNGIGAAIGANIGILLLLQVLYQVLEKLRIYNIYGYFTMFADTQAPIGIGILISSMYVLVSLAISVVIFRKRDILA